MRGTPFSTPSEFQIFPYGQIELEGPEITKVIVDQEGMDSIIFHFNRRGNDLVIDYEHQTIKNEQAPAAGWITKLINRGKDGLWAVATWTQKAKAYLKNREYRYYSPVFFTRKADSKLISIHSLALTNTPRTNKLKPLVAKIDTQCFICSDQRLLNQMMGISDDDFIQYSGKTLEPVRMFESDDEKIRKLMGVSKEDIARYYGR
nr:hypothetical protein [Desulfobacula sp.]